MRLTLALLVSLVLAACAPLPAQQTGQKDKPEVLTPPPPLVSEPVPEPVPAPALEPAPAPPVESEMPKKAIEEPVNTGPTPLRPEDRAALNWDKYAGDGPCIWISVEDQQLRLVEGGRTVLEMLCATGFSGVGVREGTNQTPPGWHRITEKIGDGEPEGRVFRSRGVTKKIWQPGEVVPEDLVLTRILILEGLEPGINQGRDKEGFLVDSLKRFIYIHGTNDVEHLGEPSSKGCIRLSNTDVITLFNRVAVGTPVIIDPREKPLD